MKKVTWEVETERMYVQLVQEAPEKPEEMGMMPGMMLSDAPKSYLMMGKKGSKERVRIEGLDAELLLMALSKVMAFNGPIGRGGMGGPPGMSPFGVVG